MTHTAKTSLTEFLAGWERREGRSVDISVRGRVFHFDYVLLAVVTLTAVLVLGVVVSRTIDSAGVSSRSQTSPGDDAENSSTPSVEIGDPLVIMAPSNGHAGAALVLVAGRPLFPLAPDESLSSRTDAPFEAQGVKVQAIAQEHGIWVGESEQQRVFVEVPRSVVDGGSMAPEAMRVGELVNISGRVQPLPPDLGRIGIADPLDVARLDLQDGIIRANSVRAPDVRV